MTLTHSIRPTSLFFDPEIEALIEKISKDEFDLAGINAKHDGAISVPGNEKHFRVKVIKPLKSVIQKAIDFNHSKFQPITDIAIIQTKRSENAGKVMVLGKEKKQAEMKLILLKNEIKELKASLSSGIGSLLRKIIPALFGLCEGFLVLNMLQSASMPGFVAILMAVVTALTAGFGVHLAAHYIHKAVTAFEKKKRYGIVLATAFLVSLGLGIWRASTYTNTASINAQIDLNQIPATSHNYSVWPFVILSFVSFLVALAFELKYWISEEEQKNLRLYNDKRSEARKIAHVADGLHYQINSLNENLTIDSGTVLRKNEYASSNEQRLVTLAQHIISHYESVNVEFRPDNQCPTFFGELIDFGFKLYFIPLFNPIKEKS